MVAEPVREICGCRARAVRADIDPSGSAAREARRGHGGAVRMAERWKSGGVSGAGTDAHNHDHSGVERSPRDGGVEVAGAGFDQWGAQVGADADLFQACCTRWSGWGSASSSAWIAPAAPRLDLPQLRRRPGTTRIEVDVSQRVRCRG